jgi:CPA1 family monovalent cation:H+ antiporter
VLALDVSVNRRTIAFLLESGVFSLMGLEVGPLVDDFRDLDGSFGRLFVLSAVCLLILLWSLLRDRQVRT